MSTAMHTGFRALLPSKCFQAHAVKHISTPRWYQAVSSTEVEPVASAFTQLSAGTGRKYIMVSGKGGVGKTSLAASLAVRFAEEGHTTLVVSTDPAHSLSDSLAQDVSGGMPVMLEGTELPLWALEIDPEREKAKFKAYTAGDGKQEVKDFMGGFGLGGLLEQFTDLKLGELLDTPPPGFDEAVAIAKVQQFVKREEFARFTRIVFDTAPTGHTLRLLTTPDFVDATLGKLVRLRKKLSAASAPLRAIFRVGQDQEEAVDKLTELQNSVRLVRDLFHDADTTEFIIATIPTVLGVNESARLAGALRREGVPCSRIVVNQVIDDRLARKYLESKLKDQAAALDLLAHSRGLEGLRQLQGPYLDLEVRGLPGLQYFGGLVWGGIIEEFAAGADRRFFMLGGKGGVGKTSCSASLAVQLAAAGHTTLVVSTDPAHSLSDALDQDVSCGYPVELEGSQGQVWGMELDLDAARQELRGAKSPDSEPESGKKGGTLDAVLGSVGELLDTPPPGVDEALAIAKVIQFLDSPEYSRFSRIVFDTAPTGHTLRLLSLPDFLDTSVGKILMLQQKIASVTQSVKGFFQGNKGPSEPSTLEVFRERMNTAKALFHDEARTQFIVVTIPTVMAAAESVRLAESLRKESVPVRTLVVNQVIGDGATQSFLDNRRKDQARALQRLHDNPELRGLEVITAPLFDLEVRGLPALEYFGRQVWK
ncbi:Putative arsenical pump-driving ATPase [Auxenochlorella protothecoides]|uniref:Putative arsenical pump-driving ATPase n=2 Tax=Auxenochlorella protothecoides TaxID=3075 RepID=A0A087SRG6_AUXPR|nr:Putative arsenical pump-driving ATPase [Auxenochlorella protothecoides]KFM28320.1 Putative arsenical pump-driving ATPase [Auxenochlorella protothecoides]